VPPSSRAGLEAQGPRYIRAPRSRRQAGWSEFIRKVWRLRSVLQNTEARPLLELLSMGLSG